MPDKLIFVVTCADEKPDMATIPFALGNSALAMDAEPLSPQVFSWARKILPDTFMPLVSPPYSSLWKFTGRKAGKYMPASPVYGQGTFLPQTSWMASR
jgi:hypothetical protein